MQMKSETLETRKPGNLCDCADARPRQRLTDPYKRDIYRAVTRRPESDLIDQRVRRLQSAMSRPESRA